jgi:hypothetical protein
MRLGHAVAAGIDVTLETNNKRVVPQGGSKNTKRGYTQRETDADVGRRPPGKCRQMRWYLSIQAGGPCCFGPLDVSANSTFFTPLTASFVILKTKQHFSHPLKPEWLFKTGACALGLRTVCALLRKCKYYHIHVQTHEPWHREHLVRTTASIRNRYYDSEIAVVAQETALECLIFLLSQSARAGLQERALSDNSG